MLCWIEVKIPYNVVIILGYSIQWDGPSDHLQVLKDKDALQNRFMSCTITLRRKANVCND